MPRCPGLTKRAKKPCQNTAPPGETYCPSCKPRYANAGSGHPRFSGAGRSAFLPSGSLERCEWLLAQPDLYDLTAEIALIQTQLTQAQESLAAGEPYDRWANFDSALSTLNAHIGQDSEMSQRIVASKMLEMRALARACREDRAGKLEIQKLANQLAILQEKQAKKEQLYAELVPMNKIRELFAALTVSIYEGIPDDMASLRVDLAKRVRRLFNRPELPERAKQRYAQEFQETGDFIDAQYRELGTGEIETPAPPVDMILADLDLAFREDSIRAEVMKAFEVEIVPEEVIRENPTLLLPVTD